MAGETFLVVGGGQAAGCALAALRKAGFDGRLVLVGEESLPPYERPPLSKEYLAGGYDLAKAAVNSEAFYREADIELRLGERVASIDPRGRRVELAGGETIAFDKMLIATGSRARRLSPAGAPGIAEGAVLYFRDVADAARLAERLRPGRHLLLVGGGFIGLEIAAAALGRGCEVTLLEAAPALLSRVMPEAAARFLEALHRAQGVRVETGVAIRGLEDHGDHGLARTEDGRTFDADTVVVGIGALPNQELAVAAGLDCDDGLLVDEQCQTSVPGIFAAGDVTRHPSAFYGRSLRLETWDNARRQAEASARAMRGEAVQYDEIPWMWTDHYGRNVQMLGLPEPGDEILLRGEPGDGPFAVLSRRDGCLRSAVLVDLGRERRPLSKLMRAGQPLPGALLSDPSAPLKELAAKAVD